MKKSRKKDLRINISLSNADFLFENVNQFTIQSSVTNKGGGRFILDTDTGLAEADINYINNLDDNLNFHNENESKIESLSIISSAVTSLDLSKIACEMVDFRENNDNENHKVDTNKNDHNSKVINVVNEQPTREGEQSPTHVPNVDSIRLIKELTATPCTTIFDRSQLEESRRSRVANPSGSTFHRYSGTDLEYYVKHQLPRSTRESLRKKINGYDYSHIFKNISPRYDKSAIDNLDTPQNNNNSTLFNRSRNTNSIDNIKNTSRSRSRNNYPNNLQSIDRSKGSKETKFINVPPLNLHKKLNEEEFVVKNFDHLINDTNSNKNYEPEISQISNIEDEKFEADPPSSKREKIFNFEVASEKLTGNNTIKEQNEEFKDRENSDHDDSAIIDEIIRKSQSAAEDNRTQQTDTDLKWTMDMPVTPCIIPEEERKRVEFSDKFTTLYYDEKNIVKYYDIVNEEGELINEQKFDFAKYKKKIKSNILPKPILHVHISDFKDEKKVLDKLNDLISECEDEDRCSTVQSVKSCDREARQRIGN